MQELFSALSLWLSAHPLITGWYTAIARLLFPVLSALILVRAIRSLLRIPHTPEVWAQLSLPGGGSIPLTHWENILGRGKSADAILNYPSISRQHAALCRGEDGAWTVYDLGSKGGTAVNGTPVTEQAPVKLGDTITLGGVPLVFLPQTVGEREELEKKRQAERPAAMWPSFLWLTVFQILTAIQLTLAAGEKASPVIPICFLILTAVMWLYAAALRLGRCVGFELETIAFYLSTLSLAVTASSAPGSLPKQLLAIVLGMGLFLALGDLRGLEGYTAQGDPVGRWCWARLNSVPPTGSPWAVYPSSPRRSPRSAIFLQAPPRWNGCSAAGIWRCLSCSPACASACWG